MDIPQANAFVAVLGDGPHGRSLLKVLQPTLKPTMAVLDDKYSNYPVSRWREWAAVSDHSGYVIGAAFPAVRRQIWEQVADLPAWLYGIVVFPGAQVDPDRISIGEHTHILYNAVISHGCRIGSFVTVCSNATLCGEVTVEDDVFIGAGAVVVHGGITIGRGATVGAGAVVIDDVPAGATGGG